MSQSVIWNSSSNLVNGVFGSSSTVSDVRLVSATKRFTNSGWSNNSVVSVSFSAVALIPLPKRFSICCTNKSDSDGKSYNQLKSEVSLASKWLKQSRMSIAKLQGNEENYEKDYEYYSNMELNAMDMLVRCQKLLWDFERKERGGEQLNSLYKRVKMLEGWEEKARIEAEQEHSNITLSEAFAECHIDFLELLLEARKQLASYAVSNDLDAVHFRALLLEYWLILASRFRASMELIPYADQTDIQLAREFENHVMEKLVASRFQLKSMEKQIVVKFLPSVLL